MRLLSWNVAGRTDAPRARLSAQAEAIAGERPDLVALQEVTRETREPWCDRLAALGLGFCADSVDRLVEGRRYANLLASRWSLTAEQPLETTFPEKILSCVVMAPDGGVEVHVFHAPTGVGSGWGKIEALEALHGRLSESRSTPGAPAALRIVCGDFNAPQAEPPGRELVTFAQDERSEQRLTASPRWFDSWREKQTATPAAWDAERWDRAERQMLAPQGLGLVDVFRDQHAEDSAASWVWRRGTREVPRRFDHVFASPSLRPWAVRYRHSWRERDAAGERLSDHSGVVATFGAE